MGLEIERKFLLASDKWHQTVDRSVTIRQGYFETSRASTIRIRTYDEDACLTIKSPSRDNGMTCDEYEYPIPISEANHMLDSLCQQPIIEKVRNYVTVDGHLWEIDEFKGDNDGLVVAEIELDSPDERFEKPDWIGEEVTTDERYINACLVTNPFKEWR